MIKKLQHKFILLSMSAFFLVLSIIIASINIVNYNNMTAEADGLLSILSENNGIFPMNEIEAGVHEPERKEPEKKGKNLPPRLSPETAYETRYFSVILEKDTLSAEQVDTGRIASVNRASAIAYAKEAAGSSPGNRFMDQFRYCKTEKGNTIHIIFLDWGRKIDSFQSFLLASIGISLLGYLVVFFFIAFFSDRIIRPISESYEKQKRFITDAGHEIKTPLTIIYADADVLEMEQGENEWIDDIKKQTKRLTELTNHLVCLARMEEADKSFSMMDFPFSDVIEEAVSSFQALAQTQQKEFFCSIEPMITLRGDEKSIQQLTEILLDNALKYSPKGGTISLSLKKQNKTAVLTVHNTTKNPVQTDQLPYLFDRFYRMDSSRNSETGGHGIGLSIAKAIVKAHGGKIQASSKDSLSLTITISIPI